MSEPRLCQIAWGAPDEHPAIALIYREAYIPTEVPWYKLAICPRTEEWGCCGVHLAYMLEEPSMHHWKVARMLTEESTQ